MVISWTKTAVKTYETRNRTMVFFRNFIRMSKVDSGQYVHALDV